MLEPRERTGHHKCLCCTCLWWLPAPSCISPEGTHLRWTAQMSSGGHGCKNLHKHRQVFNWLFNLANQILKKEAFVSLWAWVILPTSDHSWGLPTNLDLVLLDLIFAMVPVKTCTLFSSWSSYNKAIINLCDDCTHWHNLLAEAIVYYLGFTSHTKSKTWEYASHENISVIEVSPIL